MVEGRSGISQTANLADKTPQQKEIESHRSNNIADDQTHFKGQKVGRNDSCPCGSGKKFKKCHGK